jgi:hypothetical protein
LKVLPALCRDRETGPDLTAARAELAQARASNIRAKTSVEFGQTVSVDTVVEAADDSLAMLVNEARKLDGGGYHWRICHAAGLDVKDPKAEEVRHWLGQFAGDVDKIARAMRTAFLVRVTKDAPNGYLANLVRAWQTLRDILKATPATGTDAASKAACVAWRDTVNRAFERALEQLDSAKGKDDDE